MTIYAPAGKVGVLEVSLDNGAPVIHYAKDTSPIADKVQVGDRLVAVDNEDVHAMTAIKGSNLISKKSSNSRNLTVIGSIKGREERIRTTPMQRNSVARAKLAAKARAATSQEVGVDNMRKEIANQSKMDSNTGTTVQFFLRFSLYHIKANTLVML